MSNFQCFLDRPTNQQQTDMEVYREVALPIQTMVNAACSLGESIFIPLFSYKLNLNVAFQE